MLEQVGTIFDGMEGMLKKLKKQTYEERTKQFREKNGHFFDEITSFVEAADEKDSALKTIADTFTDRVQEHMQVNGKIKSRTQADMNFMMIYYVFPSILMTEHANAKEIADAICEAWGKKFKDSKIGYTTYEKLYDSFRQKIFGIF